MYVWRPRLLREKHAQSPSQQAAAAISFVSGEGDAPDHRHGVLEWRHSSRPWPRVSCEDHAAPSRCCLLPSSIAAARLAGLPFLPHNISPDWVHVTRSHCRTAAALMDLLHPDLRTHNHRHASSLHLLLAHRLSPASRRVRETWGLRIVLLQDRFVFVHFLHHGKHHFRTLR
jgi:hypothetical protein